MEVSNYSRFITSVNGKFHLPTAEYTTNGVETADAICNKVRNIVNPIDNNNGVIVTRVSTLVSEDIQWIGLNRV